MTRGASFIALLLALAPLGACGGGAVRFPGAAQSCAISVEGSGLSAATCVPSTSVRIVAIRMDASGDPIVAGSFRGRLELDPSHPLVTNDVEQAFVTRLGPSLGPRFVRVVDAPGALRGLVIGGRGLAVVTSAIEGPEGPFLTRLGPGGDVEYRRDLGFGGLVSSVSPGPQGTLVMRAQNDGLRLVVTNEDGNVILSPRVAPAWVHQFPSSITEGALTSDVALGPDGVFTAHARGPSEDGTAAEQAISKVSPTGAVVWTRPAPIGTNAQTVATSEGFAVLSPNGSSICSGPLGATFAVTAFDREASVRWVRCFAGRAAGLRLASDGGGILVVAGYVTGRMDLGDDVRDAGEGLASFVVRLGAAGKTARSAWLSGPRYVTNQAVAVSPDGAVVVAGVAGPGPRQSHFYVARLTP